MKQLLYIGNYLKSKHTNLASIHILGGLLEREGYKVYYASKRVHKVLRLLEMIWACVFYAPRINMVLIDAYSTHNFYFALVTSQLCRLFRLKYLTNLNGGNLPARLKAHPKMSGLIFKHAQANVAPSLYLKAAFESYGYSNILYIPNTIELSQYPVVSKRYTEIKLLWVRSFSQLYNPQLALYVLKTLKDKGYTAELCMVGPDSDGTLKKVKTLAQQLELPVRFTGKLSKAQWIALSKDYNVFINTTNFDNTPVSVIEAMALGLPVVSTNVGGMPYLITDQKEGLLVAPEDAEAMVAAIIRLCEDATLREELIKNARLKVAQFDWEVVKKAWAEVLV